MLSGIISFFRNYFIYPADAAFLSAPFWEGVDHVLKITSFLIGVVLFFIAVWRWKLDRKAKELDLKRKEMENEIKAMELSERKARTNKNQKKDDDRRHAQDDRLDQEPVPKR